MFLGWSDVAKDLESRHVIFMYVFVMLKKIIMDFSIHELVVGT